MELHLFDLKDSCLFCHEPLPVHQSSILIDLFKSAQVALNKKSPDQIHISTIHALTCERHTVERETLQLGRDQSWPFKLNMDDIAKQVLNLKDDLTTLLLGPIHDRPFYQLYLNTRSGPNTCHLLDHTAYYGDLGRSAILMTLSSMFSSHDFDNTLYKSLPSGFTDLLRVLASETICMLIQKREDVTAAAALEIFEESSLFGEVVFPMHNESGKAATDQLGAQAARRVGQRVFRDMMDGKF
jgi:hypothetical protein